MTEYVVDLTKIDGDGPFPCPKCGAVFDPGEPACCAAYDVSDTVVEGPLLRELILKCKRCGCKVRVTGFDDGCERRALERMQKDSAEKGIEMKKETVRRESC